MIETRIRAIYYDGRSSRPRQVEVSLSTPGAPHLAVRGDAMERDEPLGELRIDEAVGGAPRFVHFADGASLEIVDGAAFDAALAGAGVRTLESSVRRLEGRWPYALAAIACIVLASWAFLKFGIPALAERAVNVIPPHVDARIGAEGLALLDQGILEPTNLHASRQEELRRQFRSIAAEAGPDGERYRLEFRGGGAIGANALALPSGIVVLTDELEREARHDDELRAVFAHEVGHLARRHAMRRLVQSSATALLAFGLFGEASGITSLVVAVPTVLVDAAYSRDLEREADDFALAWMERHDVPPERLTDLLARLEGADAEDGLEYLSSHPDLAERVNRAKSGSR